MVYERPSGELTPHMKKIVDALASIAALYGADSWVTRSELAEVLGKKRLTPYDVQILDDLATAGTIEAIKRDKPGFIPYEWVYRVK